jgi:hypothetical protein
MIYIQIVHKHAYWNNSQYSCASWSELVRAMDKNNLTTHLWIGLACHHTAHESKISKTNQMYVVAPTARPTPFRPRTCPPAASPRPVLSGLCIAAPSLRHTLVHAQRYPDSSHPPHVTAWEDDRPPNPGNRITMDGSIGLRVNLVAGELCWGVHGTDS